ncbi:hypothetical protein [Streptomyces candidus]|uniref:Uncharacterized protein n=1 Tax=Streptomyces candidus TaxID=67283 RepID=A0A7X0HPA2_9ACTN|nr:hypothetical protein [Streptomyces candidus]MBB6440119.1 hypothetical protein [Streptomyces candidus]GHH58274.1 hypothetical protein GCM10018773_66400 [Streptomyces candidus]
MNDTPLDELYATIDRQRIRISKQSHLLQELKRDNFALRMDMVALLDGITVSQVEPGAISAARRQK